MIERTYSGMITIRPCGEDDDAPDDFGWRDGHLVRLRGTYRIVPAGQP